MRSPPDPDNIRVVLNPKSSGNVYLDIPYAELRRLSLSPSRLLHYFCFIILGLEGTIHTEDERVIALEGNDDEEKEDQNVGLKPGYTYLYHTENPFTSALVDSEAAHKLTSLDSTSSQERGGEFRSRLVDRDGFGIFTGQIPDLCAGQHIIPHIKGDAWLNLIVQSRRHCDTEEISGGIDDPRNGFLDSGTLRKCLATRRVLIIKTPNNYLRPEDLPPAVPRPGIPPQCSFPTNCRFTLMWAFGNAVPYGLGFQMPADAAFVSPNADDLPSGLLLDCYNAGVISEKYLKGFEELSSHPFPRPPSIDRPPRPSDTAYRSKQDGGDADELCFDADDPCDVILRIWMMSGNAQKRHERKQRELRERINSWNSATENG
ncbi:hypothetical protein BDN70DRAFT_928050 [Pholiota conissans]|uniref:HNH nuclease domain-containing protein n=1 Tax=Pholiota conissans TaxID=109636 RepID=A0A9P5ZB44_9AGAR|nr:hypothetical protein BDN70DRAFT_928050 [Pholiota conissans]